MSNINIKRAVENIPSNTTTIYTPIVEIIVNAIQAIEEIQDTKQGVIKIRLERSPQMELDVSGALPAIENIIIQDNGAGFNKQNRDSFDTLYSDYKIKKGGKGFGRFTCLKYFEDLRIESIFYFREEEIFKKRKFSMGKENEIIVNEEIENTDESQSFTAVHLVNVKTKNALNKKLETIARILVEKLLPYFIAEDYNCPQIVLEDDAMNSSMVLNNYINNLSAVITEIPLAENSFSLYDSRGIETVFKSRIFKIYFAKSQTSKISLVADNREVTETSLSSYIPEFSEEFYDKNEHGETDRERNFIIKAYVFSDYLDENVSLERGGFEFGKESDLLYGISQAEIESKAAQITKKAVIDEISVRKEKKEKRVHTYVDNDAPWHRELIRNIDLSSFPYKPTDEEIELRLQKEKFNQELLIRKKVRRLLDTEKKQEFFESVADLVQKISESSRNDLVHYVASRKKVLDLFEKALYSDKEGKYASEATLHNIIFPQRKDSDSITYDEHNLWVIDERLNFTNYISSDLPLNGSSSERPDLIVYGQRVAFRGENETSNPVIIFEFKKPDRDDFVNPSSKENPVKQVVRYVNSIRKGKYKTPKGREINVTDNTPFYAYIICDISEKVKVWLQEEENFKPMPDKLGWFQFRDQINLYVEVISWDKLLKDANMRNRIFFKKLGIE